MGKILSKNRRSTNTNSGRTSHDVNATSNMVSGQMAQNPMHTHASGKAAHDALASDFMANVTSGLDSLINRGQAAMQDNPAMLNFMNDIGMDVPAPQPQPPLMAAQNPAPQQQAQPAPQPAPVQPQPEVNPYLEKYPWLANMDPEQQAKVTSFLEKADERKAERAARREKRARGFLEMDMDAIRGAGSYDL